MEGWGLRKHKVLLLVLFSMVLALVLTAFAHAQGYPVELAGVTVLRVRFPASGYDAEERMMIAYERLIYAGLLRPRLQSGSGEHSARF